MKNLDEYNKYNCLVLTQSPTYAQSIAMMLRRNGCRAEVVRIPDEIEAGSCGHAVSVDCECLSRSMTLLKSWGIPKFRIFVSFEGAFQECDYTLE